MSRDLVLFFSIFADDYSDLSKNKNRSLCERFMHCTNSICEQILTSLLRKSSINTAGKTEDYSLKVYYLFFPDAEFLHSLAHSFNII